MQNEEDSSSLLNEILAEALKALSEHPAFDKESLERLNELARSRDLLKFERVVSTLRTGKEQ